MTRLPTHSGQHQSPSGRLLYLKTRANKVKPLILEFQLVTNNHEVIWFPRNKIHLLSAALLQHIPKRQGLGGPMVAHCSHKEKQSKCYNKQKILAIMPCNLNEIKTKYYRDNKRQMLSADGPVGPRLKSPETQFPASESCVRID